MLSDADPASEEVWNDGTAGGAGGGGISATWGETSWQAHDKVPGLNSPSVISAAKSVEGDDFCQDDTGLATSTCREGPDVSSDGSPNTGGMVFRIDGQWVPYGGTSSSTPIWAAILADINTSAGCAAGTSVGFVPPKLYSIASIPSEYAASFNDVTVGSNDNFGASDGLFPATTGYDMATGLGSPRVTGIGGANGLAYYLCTPGATTAPTISALSPAGSAVDGGGSVSITGTGFMTGSASDVAGISIGSYDVPSADISVTSDTSATISQCQPRRLWPATTPQPMAPVTTPSWSR